MDKFDTLISLRIVTIENGDRFVSYRQSVERWDDMGYLHNWVTVILLVIDYNYSVKIIHTVCILLTGTVKRLCRTGASKFVTLSECNEQ